MLRLPPFRFVQAQSVAEAASVLAGEGGLPEDDGLPVRLVAGGTDLWPDMKRRNQKAGTVVSLMGIPRLAEIQADGADREVRLGATALLADVAAHPAVASRYPALSRAVESISSPPLRHM